MDIRIIKEGIGVEDLQKMALETFGDMVKAVVDIDKGIMAVGGDACGCRKRATRQRV